MRQWILVLFIILAVSGWTHAAGDPYAVKKADSVGQLADVAESAAGYKELKSLVEQYGIIATDNEGKFHPDEPLKRGGAVVWLNDSLNQIMMLVNASLEDVPESKAKDDAMRALVPTSRTGSLDISSVDQYKDVKPADYWYEALQSLVERFGYAPGDAGRTFRGDDSITRDELAAILKGPLQFTGELPKGSEPATRLEAAGYLARALDAYAARISAASEALHKK